MYAVPKLTPGVKEEATGNAEVMGGVPPLSTFLSDSHYVGREKETRKKQHCVSLGDKWCILWARRCDVMP